MAGHLDPARSSARPFTHGRRLASLTLLLAAGFGLAADARAAPDRLEELTRELHALHPQYVAGQGSWGPFAEVVRQIVVEAREVRDAGDIERALETFDLVIALCERPEHPFDLKAHGDAVKACLRLSDFDGARRRMEAARRRASHDFAPFLADVPGAAIQLNSDLTHVRLMDVHQAIDLGIVDVARMRYREIEQFVARAEAAGAPVTVPIERYLATVEVDLLSASSRWQRAYERADAELSGAGLVESTDDWVRMVLRLAAAASSWSDLPAEGLERTRDLLRRVIESPATAPERRGHALEYDVRFLVQDLERGRLEVDDQRLLDERLEAMLDGSASAKDRFQSAGLLARASSARGLGGEVA